MRMPSHIQITATIQNSHSTLLTVAQTTGVYVYKQGEEVLYIGKAVSLRARLLSHEQNAQYDAKEQKIVSQSDTIDLIYTDSELKALLLEAYLIARLKPKYNVRWKDDKSYLYIKITTGEAYPKVLLSRKENDGVSAYFGPFSSVRSAETLLRNLRRIVPFCMQKSTAKRACFYAKIGLCNPCPGAIAQLTDPIRQQALTKEYKTHIRYLLQILQGKTERIFETFRREIKKSTKLGEYEHALIYRDAMRQLEYLLRFSDSSHLGDLSIITHKKSADALFTLLHDAYPAISSVERLECFDNSTLVFTHSVASMVVFTEGRVDKKEYRRFKLNSALNNDFDMMKEVMERRITHTKWPIPQVVVIDGGKPQLQAVIKLREELIAKDSSLAPWADVAILGIAKNPDRLIIIRDNTLYTLAPDRSNLGFRLIQNARDEAHRFAKKYHTHLRSKAQMVQ